MPSVAALADGRYTVTAEHPGFKRSVTPPVDLDVQQRIALNIALQVGQISESIEVTAATPLLETETSMRPDVSATREYKESVERICRLLKLISPEHDTLGAFAALESGDARLKANALEYLENTVKPRYRRLLIPLLEFENESGLDSAT